MDKDTRNAIERATQRARKLLEDDFASQLEGTFDVLRTGIVAAKAGAHLTPRQIFDRDKIIAAIEHKRAAGMSAADAVVDYLRDAAFTALNRFVALKMLEARELVQECITKGEQSAGYREFCGLAPGVALLPDSAGYRLYIESLFDELSTEVKVLFDRRDPASVLWPKRATFEALLEALNAADLAGVWREDETIGWVYQFFNGTDERRAMRDASLAPRNSRELAVRNQFFTPRYVVQLLTENTLGRLWNEMMNGGSLVARNCTYLLRRAGEGSVARVRKDPRDLRVLDPACGSGHFLLCGFDLLVSIYEEAWSDAGPAPLSAATGKSLHDDYRDETALRRAIPGLILRHNLHGVDIDPRCAQIAQLALWMRAQRAFRDLGVAPGDRPPIRRANIIVAEPMPAEEDLRRDFIARLDDRAVADHFDKLIDAMRLAGDLGVLLRLEALVRKGGERGKTGNLFAPPEERIRSTLSRFADEAATQQRAARRLFFDDVAHGLGLVELVQEHFDVVLMNPPFGQPVSGTFEVLASSYPGAHHDIFAAFVTRAAELAPDGYVGCISSRSFLVTTRLESFRRQVLLPSLTLLADLGPSVMDNASVEAAAYTLQLPVALGATFAVLSRDDVQSTVAPDSGRDLARSTFESLPCAKILHGLPSEFLALLRESTVFEGAVGTAREGMKSFDNSRFVRAWWEIDPDAMSADAAGWTWFAKGGGHIVWFAPADLVLNWKNDGQELQELNRQLNGSTAQVRQASTYWRSRGATYSRRSIGFAARVLPDGHIFSTEGPAVLMDRRTTNAVDHAYLLGWLNARVIRVLIEVQANKQKYLTGILKRLPWRRPKAELVDRVRGSVLGATSALVRAHALLETSPQFAGLPRGAGFDASYEQAQRLVRVANEEAVKCQQTCDSAIDELYGVDSSRIEECLRDAPSDGDQLESLDEEGDDDERPSSATSLSLSRPEYARRIVEWGIGVALGRWEMVDGATSLRGDCDVFGRPSPQAVRGNRAQRLAGVASSVASEDWEARDGLLARVRAAIIWLVGDDEQGAEGTLCAELGVRDLRDHLAGSSGVGAWATHLAHYTSGRRRAPIYWRLSAQPDVGIWINFINATQDTMAVALKDVIEPWRLYLERAEATAASAADRKRISTRADGLRLLESELRIVAPLWRPHLDDGAAINCAPLWRLFPHSRIWQKELRSTWDGLCGGDYDWSHLAMHLWPERVVPKCAADRSLAIAHGVEDVFWAEGADGKWKARTTPSKPVDQLVGERSSSAVKAALKSLLDAPTASGTGRARGRRAVASATTDGGVS